jgi:hypothetical protein
MCFRRGVFLDKVLSVKGLARFTSPKISRQNLKAKVLCTNHNSELSDLDSEAKTLSDALRTHLQLTSPMQSRIRIDGWKIERWCMKCGHNLLSSRWLGDRPFLPDPAVVGIIFGSARLGLDAGLFVVKKPEVTLNAGTDQVGWSVINDSNNEADIHGFYFQLHGLGLFVTTRHGDPTPALRSANLSANALDWSQAELTHRPAAMDVSFRRNEWAVHESARLTIEFTW